MQQKPSIQGFTKEYYISKLLLSLFFLDKINHRDTIEYERDTSDDDDED